MDLRGVLQGLVAPERQPTPPRPFRRGGGILLVPAQFILLSGPILTPFDHTLNPGITESPPLPYEVWSFSSFAIPYVLVAEQGEAKPELGEAAISARIYLALNGVAVWAQDISQSLIMAPNSNHTEAQGTISANLSTPLRFAAGDRISLGIAGSFPLLREPATPGLNCNVSLGTKPLQIPYTVEGG